MEKKFKEGDRVKIVCNPLTPSSVGKIGTVVKSLPSTNCLTEEPLYKVQLEGRKTPLEGWAEEDCLELATD